MEDKFSELEDAATRNDCEKMDLIFNHTANKLWQITHMAAEKGNLNVIKYLAQKWPLVIEKKNADGETVAHVAAKFGRTDVIEYIEQKHSPCTWEKNKNNETYIHIAARFGRLEIIQCAMKLHAGKCVLAKNVDGETPLHIAVRNGHLSILQYLIEYIDGGYSYSNEEIIMDLFTIATQNGYLNIFKYLRKKYYLNSDECFTLAKIAAENGGVEIFFFLAEGGKVLRNDTGVGLLHKVFKKNITDPMMLKSVYQAYSLLVNDTKYSVLYDTKKQGHEIAYVAAKERNVNVICYLAENEPSLIGSPYFLSSAAQANALNSNTLKVLNEKGVKLNDSTADYYRNTILHFSAKNGNLDVIQWLGEREPGMLQLRNRDGDTVPYIAAQQGHKDILICIAGICPKSLNIRGSGGETSLQVAIKKNVMDEGTLKLLVEEKGVALNGTAKNGNTIAHTAVKYRRGTLLKYLLLQHEPSLTKLMNKNGDSVLHLAVKGNETDLSTFKWLVEKAESLLSQSNAEGETPAYVAVENKRTDVVQYLLQERPSAFNDTTLDLAVERNYVDLQQMKLLIKNGVSPGKNITSIVAEKGDLDFTRYLVENIPSVYAVGDVLADCARHAVSANQINIVEYLLERYPDVFSRRLKILSQLSDAKNITRMIKCLAKACSRKISHWDRRNFCSLVTHLMVRKGHKEVIKYFLEQEKWDVNIMNKKGEPPVFTAVRNRRHDILRYLVSERNANSTVLNLARENILFVAVRKSDFYSMKYVLDERKIPFDLEWRNNEVSTILHIIFKNGLVDDDFDILKYLVEDKGINVNSRKLDGSTALHMAAHLSRYDVCDYLLEHGADPKSKDSEGRDFYRFLHFSSPLRKKIRNQTNLDEETRKRRSIDLLNQFTGSAVPFSYSLADQSSFQSVHRVGGKTDDVDLKIHTPIIGFLGFLTMAKYFNKRNTNGNLREYVAFQSPAATLCQRMDQRAIRAVNTLP